MDFGDSIVLASEEFRHRRRYQRLKLVPYFDLSVENENRARQMLRFHLPPYMVEVLGIQKEDASSENLSPMTEEDLPRTLSIHNLNPNVTEDFIATLFGQIGPITKTVMLFDNYLEPCAFVEYIDHKSAKEALHTMNKRMLLDKEMLVKWSLNPVIYQRSDTSRHYHIFIGDLSPEVDNKALKEAFEPFGDVSDAKVIRDPQTLKSKGYGFVSYPQRDEAQRAISEMAGRRLGRRMIRTNWATRKFTDSCFDYRFGADLGGYAPHARPSYEDILSLTGPTNSSVFIGNIAPTTTDDDLRFLFRRFGTIVDIRHFKTQGHSFVKFDNNESAARAIHEMNGAELMGQSIRCSWGKADSGRSYYDSSSMPSLYASYI